MFRDVRHGKSKTVLKHGNRKTRIPLGRREAWHLIAEARLTGLCIASVHTTLGEVPMTCEQHDVPRWKKAQAAMRTGHSRRGHMRQLCERIAPVRARIRSTW